MIQQITKLYHIECLREMEHETAVIVIMKKPANPKSCKATKALISG